MSNIAAISIVIPTYNYAHLLTRAIDSVINQTLPAAELIIVDDGSNDNTQAIVQIAQSKTQVTQIHYHYQDNRGAGAARNHGAKLASQAWILFLDADDELLPDAIMNYWHIIAEKPPVEVVFARSQTLSKKNTLSESKLIQFHEDKAANVSDFLLHKKFSASTSGRLLLKTAIATSFPYPENIRHGEDIVLVALLLANTSYCGLNKVVVTVHSHATSLRNQHQQAIPDLTKVVDLIFNSPMFPDALQGLKQDYQLRRLHSQAQTYLKLKDGKKARQCLKEALMISASAWLNMKWIKRYLKSFWVSLF